MTEISKEKASVLEEVIVKNYSNWYHFKRKEDGRYYVSRFDIEKREKLGCANSDLNSSWITDVGRGTKFYLCKNGNAIYYGG